MFGIVLLQLTEIVSDFKDAWLKSNKLITSNKHIPSSELTWNSVIHRFQGGKRDELIGITYNRLIRMDASTGDAIKTWRFANMKQWNVNWEIKMVWISAYRPENTLF